MYGKNVDTVKKSGETHTAFADRTWHEKVHLTEDGQCCFNRFAVKNALELSCKWLSKKIEGEGKKTYTQRFASGVVPAGTMLMTDHKGKPLTIDDVDPILLFVPSNGKRGGETRVNRIFPTLHEWQTRITVNVFDEKISDEVMREHLEAAGKFVGFGSMRIHNNGVNGRFLVKDFNWEPLEV